MPFLSSSTKCVSTSFQWAIPISAKNIGRKWQKRSFVARNFRILHPIIKDAESGQIWHFVTMPGAEYFNINYNYNYCMHFQAI
jgi:hypothetical protein